jgi:hypothetical protein
MPQDPLERLILIIGKWVDLETRSDYTLTDTGLCYAAVLDEIISAQEIASRPHTSIACCVCPRCGARLDVRVGGAGGKSVEAIEDV